MEKYGITPEAVGISIPVLRSIAKEIGNNHELALKLWEIDLRDTRILASIGGRTQRYFLPAGL